MADLRFDGSPFGLSGVAEIIEDRASVERFAALRCYDILDTPHEREFDQIVELAADICESPIALVSLVAENRQWFKAKVGVELTETPLNVSVCAHAVLQEGLLTIPEAGLPIQK